PRIICTATFAFSLFSFISALRVATGSDCATIAPAPSTTRTPATAALAVAFITILSFPDTPTITNIWPVTIIPTSLVLHRYVDHEFVIVPIPRLQRNFAPDE